MLNRLYITALTLFFALSVQQHAWAQDSYKNALQKLTQQQRDYLDYIDNEIDSVVIPINSITVYNNALRACTSIDTDIATQYKTKLRNYTLRQLDLQAANTNSFDDKIKRVDFIDKTILAGRIERQRQRKSELFLNNAEASAKTANNSYCQGIKAELDKYAAPYAPVHPEISFGNTMLLKLPNSSSCNIGTQIQTPKNETISLIIVFRVENGRSQLEFSTKIFGADRAPLNVEDAWINFGLFDTRTTAEYQNKNTQTLIGTMPMQYIAGVLYGLRDGDITTSGRIKQWNKPFNLTLGPASASDLNQMTSCIAKIEPRLKEALKNYHFSVDTEIVNTHTVAP